MERVVAHEAPLDPRPEDDEAEHDGREEHAAPERVGHERVAVDHDVEAGHEPQPADEPAEVPVGLRPVGREVRVVRPPQPDGIDLDEPAEEEEHAGGREREPERARCLLGPRRDADDPPLRLAPAAELRVVAQHDEGDVQREQSPDQRREEEDVRHVHARPQRRLSREGAVEEQRHEVGAHERDRHPHRPADRESHPREQVVGERVAEIRLEERKPEHRHADHVRQLPRLAIRTGEEDPEQVQHDRRDEDVRSPVVRLPDEQPSLHRRRDVQHRPIRLAHVLSAQRHVRPVVDDLRGRVDEEQRQVDAGGDEDDERVQRHLAEQERPVVGEQVAERLAEERRGSAALVEEADDLPDHVGLFIRTPDHEGPTGPSKFPRARSSPLRST